MLKWLIQLGVLGAVGFVVTSNMDAIKDTAGMITGIEVGLSENVEMANISRTIIMAYLDTEELPLDDFPGFLRKHMRTKSEKSDRDPALDMWGTPFRLAFRDEGYEITSAGPDATWGTPDDIAYYQDMDIVETESKIRMLQRRYGSGN